VAPRVSAVIYRALDEHPEQRFDDAASMLAEVELCAAELGTRATADQLGRLVQHLMEDEEFLTDRHGHYQVQRPVPRPAGAVTRSLSSGGPAREERGAAPVDPSALALAQTAIAPAEASGAEDLVTQVIRGRGEREHFGEVDTQVVHEDERADFEQLETRVVRGRRDESEDLATQIHRGGRDATPAPTAIASDLGLAQQLRDAPGDPSLAEPSQEQRLAPSPPVDAERAGTAPVSRDPAAQPVDPPPWAFAPRALDRDFEDGPTEVEQSPWLDSTGRAQSPTAAAPAAPGPDQTRTEVIRTRSGKRRSVRLMLLVLLLAVIFAGLGAQVVVRWMGERDRSPWPPEPAEAPASTDVAPVSSDPTPASSDPTPASSDPAPAGAGSASVDQVPRTEPQTEPAAAPGREPRTPAPAGRVAAPGGGRSPSPAAAPRTPEEQPQPERARPVAEPAAAPAAPAAATATRITVTADPPGRAYVDGRLVGPRTPVRATPVAPGEHRVMVVYSSTGRSETRSVRVRAGEHVVVSFAASP
jgi:cytoskeletal protein RodZ